MKLSYGILRSAQPASEELNQRNNLYTVLYKASICCATQTQCVLVCERTADCAMQQGSLSVIYASYRDLMRSYDSSATYWTSTLLIGQDGGHAGRQMIRLAV